MIPSRLGILHPTGYPLVHACSATLFTLIPVGSVAYRANLLSAAAAAGGGRRVVLIMVRLGVRPVDRRRGRPRARVHRHALAGSHVLGDERPAPASSSRCSSIARSCGAPSGAIATSCIGALLGGLCVSNHGLAITVVPIVILFVLVDARRELGGRPWLLVQAGAAFALGLLPYLYLPLRASPAGRGVRPVPDAGTASSPISAAPSSGATCTSCRSRASGRRGRRCPQVVDHLLALRTSSSSSLGLVGHRRSWSLRDRWFGAAARRARRRQRLLLRELPRRPVALPADELADPGDRARVRGRDPRARTLVDAVGPRGAVVAFAILVAADRAARVELGEPRPVGQPATASGSRSRSSPPCPTDAVLVTYWDALTPLSYKHCVEGVRPDVACGLRRDGARDLRPGRAAADRRREAPARLRPHGVPRHARSRRRASTRSRSADQAAVGQALPGIRPHALPAGARRPAP